MDYADLTREQILAKISHLEMLLRELRREQEQKLTLEYAWTGNLGHWYWHIKTNEVAFNPLKVLALGYDPDEIPEHVSYQYFTDRLHPDDYGKTMEAMRAHLHGRADVYECEYRIRAKDKTYKWYYDRGKVTQYGDNGEPLFVAGIVFDITEKKETQLELEEKNRILADLSMRDGLTGVGNHAALIERLKTEIETARATGNPLSLALFDVDGFKRINDSRGHVFGDQVLVDVAAVMRKTIRKSDFAGRYGGDEFMVIFPDTELAGAGQTSERIRQAVLSREFADGLQTQLSGGISQYGGETVSEFILKADKRLYAAKNRGKNQIVTDLP